MENFDIKAYLDDRGIKHSKGGSKNVSYGWIGIRCPFCGDHSNHCGVNLRAKNFSCFICGEHGGAVKLVSAIEGCDTAHARSIIYRFREDSTSPIDLPVDRLPPAASPPRRGSSRVLPDTLSLPLKPIHKAYLRRRGFDPKVLIEKYRLTCSEENGRYGRRIVAPFFLDRKIVTYISIDITGTAAIKYLPCPKDLAIISHKRTLYNIDNVRNRKVAIVEGPFDVWRIGDGAVATMGIQFTRSQIHQLVTRRIKEAYVIFDTDPDGDGQRMGLRLANQLSAVIPKVEYIELNEGDPDDLDEESLNEIRGLLK